jgi:hypothetical protein
MGRARRSGLGLAGIGTALLSSRLSLLALAPFSHGLPHGLHSFAASRLQPQPGDAVPRRARFALAQVRLSKNPH